MKNKIEERKRGDEPAPISVKNKTKKSLNFSSATKSDRLLSPVSNNSKSICIPEIDYINMNDHHRFYYELSIKNSLVDHPILNFRQLKKQRAKPKPSIAPIKIED